MKKQYFLLIVSIMLLFFGLTITLKTMSILNNAHVMAYSGAGVREFLSPILGLISEGSVHLFSPITVKLILIVGAIGAYISIFNIINKDNNVSFRNLLTKEYWSNISWSFIYSPQKSIKRKRR